MPRKLVLLILFLFLFAKGALAANADVTRYWNISPLSYIVNVIRNYTIITPLGSMQWSALETVTVFSDEAVCLIKQSSDGTISGSYEAVIGGTTTKWVIEGKVINNSITSTTTFTQNINEESVSMTIRIVKNYSGTVSNRIISGIMQVSYSDNMVTTNEAGTVTSNASGTTNGNFTTTILKRLPDPLGKPDDHYQSTKDPINIVFGNMYLITTDQAFPGKGINFEFTRTYNSQSTENNVLGYGWTHSYNLVLTENAVSHWVRIKDEQGKTYLFTDEGSGAYFAQIGDYSTLVKNATGFIWRLKNGKQYLFNLAGKLTKIKDRNANPLTLTYDASNRLEKITDTVNRVILLEYDGSNHLIRVKDPLLRIFSYGYDANNNLTSVIDPLNKNIVYAYDVNHNLTQKTDPRGKLTTFTYDASDRCTSSSGENNSGKTTLLFDPVNKKTIVTDSFGQASSYDYNLDDEITRVINHQGKELFSTWDAYFRLASRTDELGRATLMDYDTTGNLIKVTDPLGQIASFTYEPTFNLLKTSTDTFGSTTTYTYDAQGNLLTAKDTLNNITAYSYNTSGQPLSVTNPKNQTTTFSYDSAGNLTQAKDALNNAAIFNYDTVGNLTQKEDAHGNITRLSYDALNRLTQVTSADNSLINYTYDEVGNRISSTDQESHTTNYTYDQDNQVRSVTDPQGNCVRYDYDTEGNLTTVTDQNGNQTHYIYDSLNRLTEQEDALGKKTKFEYDAVGNLLKKTDAKGQIITYEYDLLNRLKKIIYPTGSPVTYAYDSLGRRTSMVDSRGTTNYTYDVLSRVLSVDGPLTNDTVTYTYDAVSNRNTMVDPDAKTTRYAYDALNRLSSITDAQNKITSYTYDSLGNLTNTTYPNGLKTVNVYDTLNRLTKLTQQKSAAPYTKLNEFTYNYDLTGRKKANQALDGSLINYTYDPAGRLTQETKTTSANPYQISYEYDSVSNRSRMSNNGLTHTYTYNELNQLTEENITSVTPRTTKITVFGQILSSSGVKSVTVNNIAANFDGSNFTCSNVPLVEGPNTITVKALNSLGNTLTTKAVTVIFAPSKKISYTYDLNGNLTQKVSGTKATNYSYDNENRLTKVSTNGKETLFQYDGEGKRTRLTEDGSSIDYLYDASNCIIERNASSATTASYLRNPYQPGGIGGIIKGTTSQGTVPEFYYLYNAQGSVTTLTNTTGTSTNSNDYDSFGNTITQSGTSSNPYQYSTKAQDSTGLIYFGARYYDPKIGRFITADPLEMVDGPNLYVYCLNDPVNFIDPLGLDTLTVNYELINFEHRPTNEFISHTYTVIANEGVVTHTFSWGNNGQGKWFPDDPLDMEMAQEAINSGIFIWVGNKLLDPFVLSEFNKVKSIKSIYFLGFNDCKENSYKLIKNAKSAQKKREQENKK